jgi:hypothetical protein
LKLKYQQQRGWNYNFQGKEIKGGKKNVHRWQTGPPKPICATPNKIGHGSTSNDMEEGYFWTPRGVAHTSQDAQVSSMCLLVL